MSVPGTYALNPQLIHRKWPPKGGWIYRQPETQWRSPSPMGNSFSATVENIIRHRKANPQLGMDSDRSVVERDLQQYTALRLLSDAPDAVREWVVPLDEAGVEEKKKPSGFVESIRRAAGAQLAVAVDRVRKDIRGLAVLGAWVGAGGKPVSADVAERRALVCSRCPKNRPGYKPEALVARAIRLHEAYRHRLNLTTSLDAKLKSCSICHCHLPLKVWVPISKVRQDTNASEMPDWCWIKTEQSTNPSITLRRSAAYGDVIVASVVAERIKDLGFETTMLCNDVPAQALVGHPIRTISSGNFDVDLDATYELHPEIGRRHIYSLLFDAADTQLRKMGKRLGPAINCLPTVVVTQEERDAMAKRIPDGGVKLAIIPRSNAWLNRTVPEPIWRVVSHALTSRGVKSVWTGMERGYAPLVNVQIQSFRDVMAAIACSDLVATVDTGPMHVAAALRKPILAIQQAFRIDLRLTDHSDWQSVGPDLECLGCCQYHCPIDKKAPPCAKVPPSKIVDAVIRRLGALDTSRVGAVIPVYKPDIARLRKVVASIEHQVDEIVIALDADATVQFDHPRVTVIKNHEGTRTGYGKTVMRGARHTNSGWLLLLNDDCFLDPGAVVEMRNAADDRTAVVGCLLRYPDRRIQHGGAFFANGGVGWGHIDHGKISPTFSSRAELDGVTFAAALVRRSAFYSVGGFDDRFDSYGEDEDFCRMMKRDGWKIMYTPLAEGVHEEGRSTNGQEKHDLIVKAHEVLRKKWLPA